MPMESSTVTPSVCPVELSIVVPLYNEFQNLDCFFRRLFAVLQRLELTFEVICVDDGSTDNTLPGLLEYLRTQPSLKVINLSRNFGKETALTAGLDYAEGAAVVPLDADLQHPPELIEEFVEKWKKGYDVVYATCGSAQAGPLMKRATRRMFYWFLGHVAEIRIPSDTGDFRLLDRRVVDALKRFPERTRFMKGLFAWVGFKQTAVFYDAQPRHAGVSKWNYWQLWNLALEGVTSFSSFPLKVWSYLGVTVSLCAVLYAAIITIRTLALGIELPGYASLMVVILFMGGIQLITLGVLGEYLSRIYYETKGRPLYIVRESYGFNLHNRKRAG